MFVRFVILSSDSDTGKKTGILVAGHSLRDDGDISVEEHRELQIRLKWFNDNLHIPPTYDNPQNKKALSWFKDAAVKPIRYMWDLKRILDQHGLHVDVWKSRNPGRIIYEDGWQVVAIPAKGQTFS